MAIQPEEVIEAPTEPIAEPPIVVPPPVVPPVKPPKDKEEKVSKTEAKLQIDFQRETINQLESTIQNLLDDVEQVEELLEELSIVKRLQAMNLAIASNAPTEQLVKLAEEIYAFLTNDLTVK